MLGYNNFTYQNQELNCDGVAIKDIVKDVPTPLYIYSAEHIKKQYNDFINAMAHKNFKHDILVAFAIKASSNIAILKILAQQGAGGDIVSGGELRRALLAGIPANKIMFSGVGKTDEEISFAITQGIKMFNVESVPELKRISEIAQEMGRVAPISLRINPDVIAHTLPGISTGKKGDKFGIAIDMIEEVYAMGKELPNLDMKGLDFHIGSQIFNVSEFEEAFSKVRTLIGSMHEKGLKVHHVDCGGGLGVPYHEDETPPSLSDYADLVYRYFGDLSVDLAFEPGRFIVGNSAIMVSSVVYEKQDSDDWQCVIMDAGMNDLVRPAMYDAYHHIIPVEAPHENVIDVKPYDIVGPVCESTDCFAKNYLLPVQKAGDMLAFLTAGAYGATMSSRYNTRLDIPEVLVENGKYRVIRKRPTYEDLFRDEIF